MVSMRTWVWLPLAVWLGMPAALAQVTLETEVRKVVSTLDPGGRVERQLVPVEEVVPGEELRYTITFTNDSNTPVEAERIVITNPIPDGTAYVPGSAGGEGSVVEYSLDGQTWSPVEPSAAGAQAGVDAPARGPAGGATVGADGAGSGFEVATAEPPPATADAGTSVRSLRWTYRDELRPGESESVVFHVRMQ